MRAHMEGNGNKPGVKVRVRITALEREKDIKMWIHAFSHIYMERVIALMMAAVSTPEM
jgi:hypothetical protein